MNAKLVKSFYKNILDVEYGAKPIKIDLHIHTPSSVNDYTADKIFDSTNSYLKILDEVIENDIKIISITDHNTFDGYNKINEILTDPKINIKYKDLLILCGIEITCFSKHLLAIFDNKFDTKQQDRFLHEIGLLDQKEEPNKIADVYGPKILLEIIAKYGGLSILAHADTESGFLYPLCRNTGETHSEFEFSGTSLATILNSKDLHGIQLANHSNDSILKEKLCQKPFNYSKSKISFLYFSDSHGHSINGKYLSKSGKAIGTYFTTIKLSEISFQALKIAITESYTRILPNNSVTDYPYIIGCAINSNEILKTDIEDYTLIRFNKEMNCIIGARGTGKSTILNIAEHLIKIGFSKKYDRFADLIEDRFSSAIIFISTNNKIYAISDEPYVETDSYTNEFEAFNYPKIYVMNSSGNFKPYSGGGSFLQGLITLGYHQRELYEYSSNPNKILEIIDDFILWKTPKEYKKHKSIIDYNINAINELTRRNSPTKEKTFYQNVRENDLEEIIKLHRIINSSMVRISSMREKMIIELNKYLKDKVFLTLKRKLSKNDIEILTEKFPVHLKQHMRKYEEYRVQVSNIMKKVVLNSDNDFLFFILLLQDKKDDIISKYNLAKIKDIKNYLSDMQSIAFDLELSIFVNDNLGMVYNVSSEYGQKETLFRETAKLSLGQSAVALLLIILNASYSLNDNRPFMMDQPEDDLDNSYIYTSLVKEFRNSKQKRQIIISTHNANLPVSSDAENVLVLKYDGKYGYISNTGSLDKCTILEDIVEILEGGPDAIELRVKKYSNSTK